MKEYKIEIWIFGSIADTYESDNVEEVLKWFNRHWRNCYDNGGCAIEVYQNDKRLSFYEVYNLGFD